MNRLLVRRYSMSSIEEEDESSESDEAITQIEKLPLSLLQRREQLYHSPSVLEWDSEVSESEQELEDQNDNGEGQAANRVLQNFIQSNSRVCQTQTNDRNGSYSPFSIHLYDEEDSAELDVIISELRDFKFEECSNLLSSHQQFLKVKQNKIKPKMNNYLSTKLSSSSSSSSTNGCVYELRTLEDQLEAALASLTLTINDCTTTNIDSHQQRSSDSSACSSGLGDEIGNETFNLYNISNTNHHTASLYTSKFTTITDDCDSAFSDSGSTDKVALPNPTESLIYRSMLPMTCPTKEPTSIILDNDDLLLSSSQHPSKILVRTYNDDGSTKSIFIDDTMLIRDVLFALVQKNHREPDIDYTIVEVLPDLHMERIFEDHQKLSEAILMWPTVSSNRLNFTKYSAKYSFFQSININDDLLQTTPDIEGIIYLKEKSRKSWKKHFCVLRSSALYFIPKGKSKKDLVCLAKFENVELFFGLEWKKKFKSPSDFCFALKHPLIQKKSSKYIKYMCVDTKNEFDRWIMNIRIAKFGQQLKINYFLMDKAMNIYRASGRFAAVCAARSGTPLEQQQNTDVPVPDRRTPIPQSQYYAVHPPISTHDDNDENSPIKSASYMDELRQRLERVVNDPPPPVKETIRKPPLISPPKFKSTNSQCLNSTENLRKLNNQIKPPITVGSTPLPRKQIQAYGNLSYRTLNSPNRQQQQQQMSKSFIIPSKREEYRSASSLSITSKSDSLNLDDTDFSPPSSTFLESLNNKISNSVKPKPTVINNMNINRLKQPPLLKKPATSFRSQPLTPVKNGLTTPPLKLSTPILPTRQQNNSLTINKATTPIANKPVPPVPPRKSSIPRCAFKPQPPQRDSSTNLLLRKPYISHL